MPRVVSILVQPDPGRVMTCPHAENAIKWIEDSSIHQNNSYWLVASTPLTKYESQLGLLFRIYGEKSPKPPTRLYHLTHVTLKSKRHDICSNRQVPEKLSEQRVTLNKSRIHLYSL